MDRTMAPPRVVREPIGACVGDLNVCSSSALMDFLGRRHMLHVLRLFEHRSVLRHADIRHDVDASPSTLAQRLRELEAARILSRRAFAEVPPRVEYALTEKGRDLLAAVRALDGFLALHGTLGRERGRSRAR